MSSEDNRVQATRVLVVFANPRGPDTLALANEERVIKECVKLSENREHLIVDPLHAANIHDVRRALLCSSYRIVQFSSHGTGQGLVLEDTFGNPAPVPQEPLADLLSAYSPPLECVVLNACYSGPQGVFVSKGVPYVIALESTISDDAAIEFTRGFYDALGAGKSIEFAFDEGCRNIRLTGLSDDFAPVLYNKRTLSPGSAITVVSEHHVHFEETEEKGFCDYLSDSQSKFEESTEIVKRIGKRIRQLGDDVTQQTEQLKSVGRSSDGKAYGQGIRIINQVAEVLDVFAVQMDEETVLFSQSFSSAIDGSGKAAGRLTTDFDLSDPNVVAGLEQVATALAGLRTSIGLGREGLAALMGVVASLPRMTGKLNRAKRNCGRALESFDKELISGVQLMEEIERLVEKHASSGVATLPEDCVVS